MNVRINRENFPYRNGYGKPNKIQKKKSGKRLWHLDPSTSNHRKVKRMTVWSRKLLYNLIQTSVLLYLLLLNNVLVQKSGSPSGPTIPITNLYKKNDELCNWKIILIKKKKRTMTNPIHLRSKHLLTSEFYVSSGSITPGNKTWRSSEIFTSGKKEIASICVPRARRPLQSAKSTVSGHLWQCYSTLNRQGNMENTACHNFYFKVSPITPPVGIINFLKGVPSFQFHKFKNHF